MDDWWPWLLVFIGAAIGAAVTFIVFSRGSSLSEHSSQSIMHRPAPQLQEAPKYVNKETWTWVDWRGRERKLTVCREAKAIV